MKDKETKWFLDPSPDDIEFMKRTGELSDDYAPPEREERDEEELDEEEIEDD